MTACDFVSVLLRMAMQKDLLQLLYMTSNDLTAGTNGASELVRLLYSMHGSVQCMYAD